MKRVSVIAFVLTIVTLSACGGSNPGGGDQKIPNEVFSEQNPLIFAQNYVRYVQGDASKEDYGRFLYPKAREELNSGSQMRDFMYKSALRENSIIDSRKVLSEDAGRSESGGNLFFHFRFDEEIEFKRVYPHSPYADEELVIKEGQIGLKKVDGRWKVVGHSLNAVEP